MNRLTLAAGLRAAAPQAMTALRVVFGATAIVAAVDGDLWRAATLITIGAVADGLDGHLARKLQACTPTGALFDYFADYLCFVVAPWTLSRALLLGGPEPVADALLGLPLLTGALRYARNGALVARPDPEQRDLPGVGTIFCAFVPVVTVFLDLGSFSPMPLSVLLPVWIATLSVLMVAPVRYPKLTRFAGASPAALALLLLMPFRGTTVLASLALVLGLLYIVAAPTFGREARS